MLLFSEMDDDERLSEIYCSLCLCRGAAKGTTLYPNLHVHHFLFMENGSPHNPFSTHDQCWGGGVFSLGWRSMGGPGGRRWGSPRRYLLASSPSATNGWAGGVLTTPPAERWGEASGNRQGEPRRWMASRATSSPRRRREAAEPAPELPVRERSLRPPAGGQSANSDQLLLQTRQFGGGTRVTQRCQGRRKYSLQTKMSSLPVCCNINLCIGPNVFYHWNLDDLSHLNII